MAAQTDLYAILGVSRDAKEEEIKSAYRRLARKYHPDVNKEKGAEDKFKEVSAAFEVLGDPEKRKLYDEFGPESLRSGFNPEMARQYRRYGAGMGGAQPGAAQSPFGAGSPFGGGGFDFSDLINDIFRQNRGKPQRAAGADIEAEIEVDLKTAALGAERDISVQRPVECPTCHGEGTAPGGKPHTCPTCHGTGRTKPAGMPFQMTCSTCGGSGVIDPPCPKCAGSGEILHRGHLRVTIPPGVADGTVLRIAGQGGPGVAGGPPGDLLLTVKLRPHPLVRREGQDLYLDLPVTVREAIEGAEVEVPTFQGAVRMTIPPGSQTGKKLRLRGRGMPSLKGRAKGDFYVVLDVVVPPPSPPVIEAAAVLDKAYEKPVRASLTL